MADKPPVAFALAAHPDDIEFAMAGTLILLGKAGYETHYMTLTNGSCGTMTLPPGRIGRIRDAEAKKAAHFIGAAYHPSFLADLEIFFSRENLCKLTAVMREVNPSVLLAPSPEDYMEDHMNASRLAVSAASAKALRNFTTSPEREHVAGDVAVYHAVPHGLHDGLCRLVWPDQYVDITSVINVKRNMLAHHRSQKEWLDQTQGMDSYLDTMVEMSAEVGRMSGAFKFAEGWRRHNDHGRSVPDVDPLSDALADRVLEGSRVARDRAP